MKKQSKNYLEGRCRWFGCTNRFVVYIAKCTI